MKVLVTGVSGFVGAPLAAHLAAAGHQVTGAARRPGATEVAAPELGPEADWRSALAGAEAVVHCAARAHVMDDRAADPLAVFRRVNRDGTLRLAEQAAAAGIRRFVFLSSIKVNGEATTQRPFRAEDAPAPLDPYGIAKAEAEDGLRRLAARTGLELAIIRPPLVHGPGAKGNLATLLGVLHRGLPLPLASVDNRRSLIGVHNLAELARLCLEHPAAAGQTWLAADGPAISTPDLIRALAAAIGRPARLLPCPPALLRLLARLGGRQAMVERLLGSLVVDDSPARTRLGWVPPVPFPEGLRRMAATACRE